MSGQNRYSLATGIVPRLRIVFLAISLILIAELVVGVEQLRMLKRSGDQLTQSSVPIFVRAAETERSLKNVLLVLQRIDDANQLAELDPLAVDLTGRLAILHTDTNAFSGTGLSAEVAGKMTVALAQIEQGTWNVLATKRGILVTEQILDTRIKDLEASRQSVLALVGDLSYLITFSTDRSRLVNQTNLADELDRIEQHYYQNQLLSNALTEIALETEAVIDASIGLRNLPDKAAVEAAGNALRFKLRGIVVLIGQLPQSTGRTDLANAILRLREYIFDEAGLLNDVALLQTHQIDLAAHKSARFRPVDSISDLSIELTNAARGQIEDAKTGLTLATNKSFLISTLAMLCSVAAIGWAVFFVVERQINRRMAGLTKAVLAIADGQTSYDVNVSGPDELGKIASALNVFKLNAQELHRSNTELEKFAYVAAHDLRSPLRAIQDLTEWTLEDTGNVFSVDGRSNMELLQRRIGRLNQLLTDLLQYARAGKDEDKLNTVSLRAVVGEVAELQDPENRYRIHLSGPCDIICTYTTPLRQILLNLISNSIKHHDQNVGHIQVHAELGTGGLICTVKDDGPGIPPKYHDRIFGLFQTLRPRDEVEGSGLGLAIIRKLLEHHNGSITVQSDPEQGRGTSFTFHMPAEGEHAKTLDQAA